MTTTRTGAYVFEDGYLCIVNETVDSMLDIAICHPKELNLYQGPAVSIPGQPGKFYRRSGWMYGNAKIDPSSLAAKFAPINYYAELGKQGARVNGAPITSRDTSPFGTFTIQFPPPGTLASLIRPVLIGNDRRWGGRVGSSARMALVDKIVPVCAPDTDARLARRTGIWRAASFILIVFARPDGNVVIALLGHNEMSDFGHKNPVEFETVFVVGSGKFRFENGRVHLPRIRLLNFYRDVLGEPSLEQPIFEKISVTFPNIEDGETELPEGVTGHGDAAWPLGASSFPIQYVKSIGTCAHVPPPEMIVA